MVTLYWKLLAVATGQHIGIYNCNQVSLFSLASGYLHVILSVRLPVLRDCVAVSIGRVEVKSQAVEICYLQTCLFAFVRIHVGEGPQVSIDVLAMQWANPRGIRVPFAATKFICINGKNDFQVTYAKGSSFICKSLKSVLLSKG